jgi:hypothetical protein
VAKVLVIHRLGARPTSLVMSTARPGIRFPTRDDEWSAAGRSRSRAKQNGKATRLLAKFPQLRRFMAVLIYVTVKFYLLLIAADDLRFVCHRH